MCLACSEFNCAHTGANIAAKIAEVISKYGLETKVMAMVTDGASSMIKVTFLFHLSYSLVVMSLFLGVS